VPLPKYLNGRQEMLSLLPHSLATDVIMRKAVDQPGLCIRWKNDNRLTDLDFADDVALVVPMCEIRLVKIDEYITYVLA